jgi:hypothetical protein
MEISKSIEQKYLHEMAVDQLAADYTQRGYQVAPKEQIGSYQPDLVVRRDNEIIIFEVKTGPLNPELRQKLAAFSDYVKAKPNYRFRVVFATPPRTKTIEIDSLAEALTSYFLQADTPESLLALSSDTLIEDVVGLEISRITVSPTGELELTGTGVFEVRLRYGGSDGFETEDAYPFEFNAVLFHNGKSWQIAELMRCEVDTSSFYE